MTQKETTRLTINGYVTQSCCTIVLNIGIWRVQKADKDGNGTSIHELLPVLV